MLSLEKCEYFIIGNICMYYCKSLYHLPLIACFCSSFLHKCERFYHSLTNRILRRVSHRHTRHHRIRITTASNLLNSMINLNNSMITFFYLFLTYLSRHYCTTKKVKSESNLQQQQHDTLNVFMFCIIIILIILFIIIIIIIIIVEFYDDCFTQVKVIK